MTPQGKKLFAELRKLAELEVQAGFTADKAGHDERHRSVSAEDGEDGTTVAHVATWNEFGTEHIPERPFMRQTVEKYGEAVLKQAERFIGDIAKEKMTADEALRKVGAMQVGLIKSEIATGDFEENAPETVRRKNNRGKKKWKGTTATPLVDTGRMRQSVHYVVKPRKG